MIVWPGLRRCVSAIQRLFNSASFYAPLTHTAVPQRAASGTTATFTRATTKTWSNNDGYLVTGLAGEIDFPGARRVFNLWTTSSVLLANGANKSLTLAAGVYQFSMGAGTGTATFSGTGGATGTLAASASGRVFVSKTISAGTLVVTASVADLADLQVVSLTSETDQTTIREYVSVGVASSPYYHGSMVDGVKCFPTDLSGNPLTTMERYKPELAATNLCLQSNAFTTTWTTSGAVTSAQNAIGPSGAANEAWTLGDTDAANLSDFRQEFVIANDAVLRGMQIRVGKTVGATTFPGVGIIFIGGTIVAAQWTVNTNLGTITARSSNVGTVAATIESAGNFWLIKMSATNNSTGNVTARIQMFPAVNADASATWVASTVGTAVFACAGFEVGWPTSYIPTTTTAVARNADVLTYTGGDIANLKTLACTFQRAVGVSSVGVIATYGDGTANERAYADLTSATALQFAGYDGGVLQWDTTASNAYTPGATAKLAFSLATNDVKMDFNGTAQTADTSATMPTATQVQVGHVNGSFQLNGNVGGIYGWTRNLSQSELGAVDR